MESGFSAPKVSAPQEAAQTQGVASASAPKVAFEDAVPRGAPGPNPSDGPAAAAAEAAPGGGGGGGGGGATPAAAPGDAPSAEQDGAPGTQRGLRRNWGTLQRHVSDGKEMKKISRVVAFAKKWQKAAASKHALLDEIDRAVLGLQRDLPLLLSAGDFAEHESSTNVVNTLLEWRAVLTSPSAQQPTVAYVRQQVLKQISARERLAEIYVAPRDDTGAHATTKLGHSAVSVYGAHKRTALTYADGIAVPGSAGAQYRHEADAGVRMASAQAQRSASPSPVDKGHAPPPHAGNSSVQLFVVLNALSLPTSDDVIAVCLSLCRSEDGAQVSEEVEITLDPTAPELGFAAAINSMGAGRRSSAHDGRDATGLVFTDLSHADLITDLDLLMRVYTLGDLGSGASGGRMSRATTSAGQGTAGSRGTTSAGSAGSSSSSSAGDWGSTAPIRRPLAWAAVGLGAHGVGRLGRGVLRELSAVPVHAAAATDAAASRLFGSAYKTSCADRRAEASAAPTKHTDGTPHKRSTSAAPAKTDLRAASRSAASSNTAPRYATFSFMVIEGSLHDCLSGPHNDLFARRALARPLRIGPIVDPREERDELYVTLGSAKVSQDKKTTPRNVEVCVVCVDDKGDVVPCLRRAVTLTAAARASRPATDELAAASNSCIFRSTVYYHDNAPVLNETLRVQLKRDYWSDGQAADRCHLVFLLMQCRTLGNTKKNRKAAAPEREPREPFAFAFLKLAGADKLMLPNGDRELQTFEPLPWMKDASSWPHNPSYLSEPHLMATPLRKRTIGRFTKVNECLTLSTALTSTRRTHVLELNQLLSWREHGRGTLLDVLQSCRRKLSMEELLLHMEAIFTALAQITQLHSHNPSALRRQATQRGIKHPDANHAHRPVSPMMGLEVDGIVVVAYELFIEFLDKMVHSMHSEFGSQPARMLEIYLNEIFKIDAASAGAPPEVAASLPPYHKTLLVMLRQSLRCVADPDDDTAIISREEQRTLSNAVECLHYIMWFVKASAAVRSSDAEAPQPEAPPPTSRFNNGGAPALGTTADLLHDVMSVTCAFLGRTRPPWIKIVQHKTLKNLPNTFVHVFKLLDPEELAPVAAKFIVSLDAYGAKMPAFNTDKLNLVRHLVKSTCGAGHGAVARATILAPLGSLLRSHLHAPPPPSSPRVPLRMLGAPVAAGRSCTDTSGRPPTSDRELSACFSIVSDILDGVHAEGDSESLRQLLRLLPSILAAVDGCLQRALLAADVEQSTLLADGATIAIAMLLLMDEEGADLKVAFPDCDGDGDGEGEGDGDGGPDATPLLTVLLQLMRLLSGITAHTPYPEAWVSMHVMQRTACLKLLKVVAALPAMVDVNACCRAREASTGATSPPPRLGSPPPPPPLPPGARAAGLVPPPRQPTPPPRAATPPPAAPAEAEPFAELMTEVATEFFRLGLWLLDSSPFETPAGGATDKAVASRRQYVSVQLGYEDSRPEAAALVRGVWSRLEEPFMVSLVDPLATQLLKLVSEPCTATAAAAAGIFTDMMKAEHALTGAFTTLGARTIDSVGAIIEAEFSGGGGGGGASAAGGSKLHAMFVEDLPAAFEGHPDALEFLRVQGQLFELLRALSRHERVAMWTEERAASYIALMDYLLNVGRKDTCIKYAHALSAEMQCLGHHTEAAFALLIHARMLPWSDAPRDALQLNDERWGGGAAKAFDRKVLAVFPAGPARERRTALYKTAIACFDAAQRWENSLALTMELHAAYVAVFDHRSSAVALRAAAAYHDRIVDEAKGRRYWPEIFLVKYIGGGFGPELSNKEFAYYGEPLQKVMQFSAEVRAKWPAAKTLHGDESAVTDAHRADAEGQWLQFSNMTPSSPSEMAGRGPPPAEAAMPRQDRQYARANGVSVSFSTRPFRKRAVKSKNEFLDQWISRRYVRTADAFPCTHKRSEVVEVKTAVLNPLENAVLMLELKNEDLHGVVLDMQKLAYSAFTEQSHTSMISGIVDAAVQGGIANFESFITGSFRVHNPEIAEDIDAHRREKGTLVEKLCAAIDAQMALLDVAVPLHEAKCPEPMRPLAAHIAETFVTLRRKFAELLIERTRSI